MKPALPKHVVAAPAPSARGNSPAPACGRAQHNPLPWSLVIGVAEGAKSGIVDADGRLVFECVNAADEADLANLELMVRCVNGKRWKKANSKGQMAKDAPFQAVAPFSIEDISPVGGA